MHGLTDLRACSAPGATRATRDGRLQRVEHSRITPSDGATRSASIVSADLLAHWIDDVGLSLVLCHGIAAARCTCRTGQLCTRPGKHPLRSGWTAGLRNVDQAIALWRETPWCNVGAVCGPTSNLVVLDVDLYRGGSESSLESVGVDKTPNTLSGRGDGSYHAWLAYPMGWAVGSSLPVLSDVVGIDVRGRGGFVLLGGANHISGNRYVGVDETRQPFPKGLLSGLAHDPQTLERPANFAPYAWAVLIGEYSAILGTEQGERTEKLLKAASRVGSVAHLGVDEEEAISLLIDAGRHCRPPLGPAETSDVVRRGWRGGLERPRSSVAVGFSSREDALAYLDMIEDAIASSRWSGASGRRQHRVACGLARLARRNGGPGDFAAGMRRIALEAGLRKLSSVELAVIELMETGWLQRLYIGTSRRRPSRWRLRIPEAADHVAHGERGHPAPVPLRLPFALPPAPGHDVFRGHVPSRATVLGVHTLVPWALNETPRRVYAALLARPGVTRAALARDLGVSASTVSRAVKRLMAVDLVHEGPARSLTAIPTNDEGLDVIAKRLGTYGAAQDQRDAYGWQQIEGRLPETASAAAPPGRR